MYIDRFSKTIENHRMIKSGDKILAALSGGSDSVAMLLLLLEYKNRHPELNISLEALHFNHQIRGNDADKDAEFCGTLCERLNVPFTLKSANVPEKAKETGKSLEEAARDLRYGALRAKAAEMGENAKIAVAHNMSDNAETVFFNIARGTSVEGLSGIKYVNNDIIRPLLDITKEETFEICKEYGIEFCTDKTNFETEATRNKIRLEIFPYIEEKLGCNMVKKLTSLSEFAENDCDFIEKEAKKVFLDVKEENKLNVEKLLENHISVSSRVVRMFIAETPVKGEYPFRDNVSISKSMVSRVLDFGKNGTSGGYIELGKGLFVKKQGKYLIFSGFGEKSINTCYNITVSEISGNEIPEAVAEAKKSRDQTVIFDKEKLFELTGGEIPELRKPRQGDVFATIGGTGSKPLRRFLTDIKIPKEERENLNILAVNGNVLHIFGVRRSKYATIQKDTKCAIIIKLVALCD